MVKVSDFIVGEVFAKILPLRPGPANHTRKDTDLADKFATYLMYDITLQADPTVIHEMQDMCMMEIHLSRGTSTKFLP